jgi:hypothetical protein
MLNIIALMVATQAPIAAEGAVARWIMDAVEPAKIGVTTIAEMEAMIASKRVALQDRSDVKNTTRITSTTSPYPGTTGERARLFIFRNGVLSTVVLDYGPRDGFVLTRDAVHAGLGVAPTKTKTADQTTLDIFCALPGAINVGVVISSSKARDELLDEFPAYRPYKGKMLLDAGITVIGPTLKNDCGFAPTPQAMAAGTR